MLNFQIHEYIKKKNGTKIGVLVAGLDDNNEIVTGYSLYNDGAERVAKMFGHGEGVFNVRKGLEIAVGRAESCNNCFNVPPSITVDYFNFIKRCERYFKNKRFKLID